VVEDPFGDVWVGDEHEHAKDVTAAWAGGDVRTPHAA
jgi:hypothetical protein